MTIIVSTHDKSDDKTVIGEQRRVDSYERGYIAEMVSDPVKLDHFVPGASAKALALAEAAHDDTPEFPVVRVEEGWSNNNRLWDGEELVRIAEQVTSLEPVGHLGHMKEEELASAFPEPQTTWIAATTRTEPSKLKDRLGQPVTTLYAAGYNLPGAKVRAYIKARAVRGVSWLGFGREIRVPGKGVQIKDFELTAFDWARKGGEGLPSSSVAALASEQTGGITVSDKALSAVTPDEFKNENPNGYKLLIAEVTQEKDKLIGEMEEKVKVGEEATGVLTKIREALGLDEKADVLGAIAALTQKLGAEAKAVYENLLDKELAKRIPGDDDEAKRQRSLVRRLVFQGEMVDKLKDAKDEDEAAKFVGEQVEKSMNEDEHVKTLIGEQTPTVIRRRDELQGGNNGDLSKNDYVTVETVRMS